MWHCEHTSSVDCAESCGIMLDEPRAECVKLQSDVLSLMHAHVSEEAADFQDAQ